MNWIALFLIFFPAIMMFIVSTKKKKEQK